MFRSTFRLTAVPVVAAFIATAPCSASAQSFLDDLFGNSDRLSSQPPAQAPPAQPQQPTQWQQPAQWQQAAPPGTAGQGPGELTMRIGRLEAQIRDLTGAIEQLQYRNQQLEAQLQRLQGAGMQGGGQPPARGPAMPPQQMPPQQMQPPPAAAPPPGRRSEGVFDPTQNPNAPGAPHVLGTIHSGGVAQPGYEQPGYEQSPPPYDGNAVGAAGGRMAGAPLDLSTLPGAGERGPPAAGAESMPDPRGGGAQVATLPPSDSPRDNYDLAYGYMMRKDYALAEDSFRVFMQRFPNDRLVPDALYWLGEAMFQRQHYRDAAEQFLSVSTKYETSARAPDALLRLGQSLAAMGEKEAACTSLSEVLRKYPRAAVGVRQGVDREQKRIHC